jgi:hypothetical protein
VTPRTLAAIRKTAPKLDQLQRQAVTGKGHVSALMDPVVLARIQHALPEMNAGSQPSWIVVRLWARRTVPDAVK